MVSKASRRQLALPIVVLSLSLLLLAGAVWMTIATRGPGAPPPSAIGGTFQLMDQDRRTVTQDDLKGQPTLIFFGYTHCPEICPTTLFEISEIFRKMGPDAKVRAVFVSIDPERDTPELMKTYLSTFDKRITGLTGPHDAIDAMAKEWRVTYRKVPLDGDNYTMDHSALVYLMDSQMRFVNALPLNDENRAVKEIERWM
jgi:protein SCO1